MLHQIMSGIRPSLLNLKQRSVTLPFRTWTTVELMACAAVSPLARHLTARRSHFLLCAATLSGIVAVNRSTCTVEPLACATCTNSFSALVAQRLLLIACCRSVPAHAEWQHEERNVGM